MLLIFLQLFSIAGSEKFIQFVDEIMSHDKDKTKYLQEFLGYSMVGARFNCVFFCYGETVRTVICGSFFVEKYRCYGIMRFSVDCF